MKIALLEAPYNIAVKKAEKPTISPTEVLIQVAACGVCGTDVDVYMGKQPRNWTVTYPLPLGHELAGTVVAVGESVPNVQVGDRVVPDGRLTCGYCYYCRRGWFTTCQNQGFTSGGLAQYSRYPFRNLVKIPANVSFEQAAFAEPLGCVVHGHEKLAVPMGGTAVVIGDGAIGLLHAQMLRHRGALVALIGSHRHRMHLARELGANVVINRYAEDAAPIISKLTEGRGADIVVNAAGGAGPLELAFTLAARRAQILFFSATHAPDLSLDIDTIHYNELQLVGSYDANIAHYEMALSLINAGIVDVETLITHRLPLEQTQQGYEIARQREGVKVQIIHDS